MRVARRKDVEKVAKSTYGKEVKELRKKVEELEKRLEEIEMPEVPEINLLEEPTSKEEDNAS